MFRRAYALASLHRPVAESGETLSIRYADPMETQRQKQRLDTEIERDTKPKSKRKLTPENVTQPYSELGEYRRLGREELCDTMDRVPCPSRVCGELVFLVIRDDQAVPWKPFGSTQTHLSMRRPLYPRTVRSHGDR